MLTDILVMWPWACHCVNISLNCPRKLPMKADDSSSVKTWRKLLWDTPIRTELGWEVNTESNQENLDSLSLYRFSPTINYRKMKWSGKNTGFGIQILALLFNTWMSMGEPPHPPGTVSSSVIWGGWAPCCLTSLPSLIPMILCFTHGGHREGVDTSIIS